MQNLHKTVGEVGRIKSQSQNHARHRDRGDAQERGQSQIERALGNDDYPTKVGQYLTGGLAVQRHGYEAARRRYPDGPGLAQHRPRGHTTDPQQKHFQSERHGCRNDVQCEEHRNAKQQGTDETAHRIELRHEP